MRVQIQICVLYLEKNTNQVLHTNSQGDTIIAIINIKSRMIPLHMEFKFIIITNINSLVHNTLHVLFARFR